MRSEPNFMDFNEAPKQEPAATKTLEMLTVAPDERERLL